MRLCGALLCVAVYAAGVAVRAPRSQVGVNLGGWLVMEPTMFDQPLLSTSNAELDVVQSLRAALGDGAALQTMRNHWEHFVDAGMVGELAAAGVTHVRIPVGYWMFDAPLGGSSMYNFGFQEEGFATGGINALEALLPSLLSNSISVLLDFHALPGCSARCQGFAGMYCYEPAFFFGRPNETIYGCNGGPSYTSKRSASQTWFELGLVYLKRITSWVAGHAPAKQAVVAITVMNEPALGEVYTEQIGWYMDGAVWSLPAGVRAAVNFVGSSFSESTAAAFVRHNVNAGKFPPDMLVDYHHYYNWNGVNQPETYKVMVCNSTEAWSAYSTYAQLPVVIGEWSLAVNYNENLRNLTNASDVAFMKYHYANQASYYATFADGLYFWNFRMGSGWDPRPTAEWPKGHQVANSAANKSLPTFALTSWSFLELRANGIIVPLSSLDIKGRCVCNACAPPK